MRSLPSTVGAFLCTLLVSFNANTAEVTSPPGEGESGARVFAAKGVIEELKPDGWTVVIKNEAITNYMEAMTMPFKATEPKELAGLHTGDEVTFRLHVNGTEGRVDEFVKTGTVSPPDDETEPETPSAPSAQSLLDYKFTNELGQAVSLNGFRGQALAITFFYTRCPMPDFCPRLSKNFQAASQKLEAMTNAPANWHFLSVSFDTEFDSPEMLKAYGESYAYDPAHWSFLTGPPEKIAELARQAGASYEYADGTFNHNFRTLIIDTTGRLQMIFPTTGDLSDQIAAEIIKAAAVANQPSPKP